MTLLDFMELCSYGEKNPPVNVSVAAYLGIGKDDKARPTPVKATARPGSAAALDRKVSADEAAMIFGAMGHAGCGMIELNVHQGFAVQQMPTTFADLKRLNGLQRGGVRATGWPNRPPAGDCKSGRVGREC